MALGIYSGKDAYIDGVACVDSWSMSQALSQNRYGASCIPGATNMPKGVENWTGNATGLGAYPEDILDKIKDGTAFAFQGVTNNDVGQGELLSVDASVLFESLTITANKESGDPITWESAFGVDGVPAESTTGAADLVVATSQYGVDADVKIGGASIETVSCELKQWQLILRRPLATRPKGGATYRKAGNLEADINFGVSTPKLFNAAWATNTLSVVRLMTGATSYWELSKIRWGARSGFAVNRKTNPPAVIGYTVNGAWNAGDAGVLGWITYFDGSAPHDVYGDSTP